MSVTVYLLHPRATPDHVGLIPGFLDLDDPRSAAEQFDEKYSGGWRNNGGATLDAEFALHYPGDPPQKPLALIPFRDEKVFIYEYGVVTIVQADGAFEWCRMD